MYDCEQANTYMGIMMDRREELFWKKVGPPDENGCRHWLNELSPKGYGDSTYKGWSTTAHRVAYFLAKGPIPDGHVVMHKCDVRSCCNPEHLEAGTQAQNLADMRAKGRAGDCRLFGEKHGRCKVSDIDVAEIRLLYKETRISQAALAKKYGIGQTQVGRIVNGESRTVIK